MKVTDLDPSRIPNHIAIILDGNGRWAKKRGLPRTYGHRKGAFNLRDIALLCDKINIKYLTVYCFSTENWKRPKDEIDYLFNQPIKYFKRYRKKIENSNIRIKFIGRRDRFSEEFLKWVNIIEESTSNHQGLVLTLACDYGSYEEITHAVKEIAIDVKNEKIDPTAIDENLIAKHLYTSDYLPLDLLIRTSGEIRISNFMLWQMAYSELYFTDTYWPDFNEDELCKALDNYAKRDRRFGGLKEAKK